MGPATDEDNIPPVIAARPLNCDAGRTWTWLMVGGASVVPNYFTKKSFQVIYIYYRVTQSNNLLISRLSKGYRAI